MNKLLLFLLLSISINSFSQKIETYKNSAGVWNEKLEKFEFVDFIYAKINFNIGSITIETNDQISSIYKIYKKDKIGKDIYYNCIDEKKRNCIVSIVSQTNDSYIVVLYDKISYIYFIGG